MATRAGTRGNRTATAPPPTGAPPPAGAPQGQAPPPPQGGFPPPAGYPQPGGYPMPGGYPQPGGFPPYGGYPQPGQFPPYGYGYGAPPPRQARTREDEDDEREDSRRERTRSARRDETEDEDDSDDEDSDVVESYEESEGEPFPYVNVNQMHRNFAKLPWKEIQADKKHGMRVQIREQSPVEMKACMCTPKPRPGILPMIYESKRCICGYGTEKMMKDLQRPVRMLWSPVDDPGYIDDPVEKFNRVRTEKLYLPTIPGTAPPGGYSNRPKRYIPDTAPTKEKVPVVAQERHVKEKWERLPDIMLHFQKKQPPKRKKGGKKGAVKPQQEKKPDTIEHVSKLVKGSYYDQKSGKVVQYKLLNKDNKISGQRRDKPIV